MRNSAKENLSDYVRRVIKEKGLTLRDVEERSGRQITNSYISKIISTTVKNPTIEKLKALARGLDEPEEKVIRVVLGSSSVEPQVFERAEEEGLQNLVRRFLTLPEEDRREFRFLWQMIDGEIERRRRRKRR
jgi:transcriptional regulator with XRE-family HTH domain